MLRISGTIEQKPNDVLINVIDTKFELANQKARLTANQYIHLEGDNVENLIKRLSLLSNTYETVNSKRESFKITRL